MIVLIFRVINRDYKFSFWVFDFKSIALVSYNQQCLNITISEAKLRKFPSSKLNNYNYKKITHYLK